MGQTTNDPIKFPFYGRLETGLVTFREKSMDTNELEALQKKVRFYETVLDNIYNGVIITDPDGKIIFFSSNTINKYLYISIS